jgi:substrate-binding family protein
MTKYNEKPDQFAALAYDAIQVLLGAICRAGLNRARIRDALTAVENYKGVTGDMMFDPNCKNISPMYLATVKNGHIEYRRATMDKPYARVGEDGVQYAGPAQADASSGDLRIAVFGPKADQIVKSPETLRVLDQLNRSGRHLSLLGISSEGPWGKASTQLVDAIYKDHVLGMISLDRASSHLAEQLAVKSFVPLIALSSDRTLTSINIPWIFRLPAEAQLEQALRCYNEAVSKAGPNPGKIRERLASGEMIAGVRFESTGEPK